MQKMKKWFGRKMGSTESLNKISAPGTPYQAHHLHTKSEHELTSIKIKQLLERKSYQKVVDLLREQSSFYILKCLESFPFKALNKAVPEAFPIWETLLTKLHNSEDGYIPEIPYNACDELVLRIAWLLEMRDEKSQEGQELIVSCRRVLKCVYMQYNDVLDHLYKEHDKVQHALYTLGLHLPLGTDVRTALSLQQAIKSEVVGCLIDFSESIERLEEISEKEELTLTEALLEDQKVDVPVGSDEDEDDVGLMMSGIDFPQAPNPNQVQLQERLYQNQCVLTCLQPSRRCGNLPELMEILHERIRGDKEVLAVYGGVRQRNGGISDNESIEPWLRRHQHSIECTIGIIKEIEKELEIKIHKSESPVQMQIRHRESNGTLDEDPQIVPMVTTRPRSRSYENERSPLMNRRHSAAIVEQYPWEEEAGLGERTDRNRLSVSHMNHRPRSTSPHKILRVNGAPPKRSLSSKSMSSSNGSTSDLVTTVQASSSSHDLNSTKDAPLAFTRVQSLKSNHSVQVVAGKRKKSSGNGKSPSSWNNLSISTGNVSGKKQKKNLYRSGSGGIGPWDRQLSGDAPIGQYFLLQKDLETKTRELLQAREQIHELRRRERELTDRLSDQAQRHLQDSEKFEDILLGPNRPTVVVQRYQELYSQGRVEALEAIEGIQSTGMEESVEVGMADTKMFAIQLVLDVLEFAYAASCSSLGQLRRDWQTTLGIKQDIVDSVAVRQLESAIALYLRRVCSVRDVTDIVKKVEELLSTKYISSTIFNQAKDMEVLHTYIKECSKVAWDLCVQTPPMVISSSENEFNFDLHTRFYNSDKDVSDILFYHWPTLLQSSPSGGILSKGVVQT